MKTKISQDNFESFLAIAEDLQLKVIMGQNDEDRNDEQVEKVASDPFFPGTMQFFKDEGKASKSKELAKEKQISKDAVDNTPKNETVALTSCNFSGNLQELDDTVWSMMKEDSKCHRQKTTQIVFLQSVWI